MSRTLIVTYFSMFTLTMGLFSVLSTALHAQTTTEEVKITTETITTVKKVKKVVTPPKPTTRRCAIFVQNRAASRLPGKNGIYSDLLVAELTDLGFQLLSPEDTVQAVSAYVNGQKTTLDQILEKSTSSLRLTQSLNVDYLLVASINSYSVQTQHLKRPDLGIDRLVKTHQFRSTYKFLGAGLGESVSAGVVTSSKKEQLTAGLIESNPGIVDDLMADAAQKIAAKLKTRRGASGLAQGTKAAAAAASFSVKCSMQSIVIPVVMKDPQGHFVISKDTTQLEPADVTVELDGLVIGSAPGTFKVRPGIHTIRLSREGFKTWERTINVTDGQKLSVALMLSEEGYQYWKKMAETLSSLKDKERLSDADAELIRGTAQKMRQSGVRVESLSHIRVDTKEALTLQQINNQVEQQNIQGTSAWPTAN